MFSIGDEQAWKQRFDIFGVERGPIGYISAGCPVEPPGM